MSTHDMKLDNANGSSFRTDLNNALKALASAFSSGSAPAIDGGVGLGNFWLDTTSSPYKLMFHNGTGWVEVLRFTSGGSPVVTVAGIGTIVQGYDVATVKTNVVNAFTRQQTFTALGLTDAATVAWNLDTGQVANLLTTDAVGVSRTLGAPTNMKDGGTYVLRVKQSATGGRTMAWNATYKFVGGSAPTLSTAANAVDIFTFLCDGTNMHCIGERQGF